VTKTYSSDELARRNRIRNQFKEIDGAALVGLYKKPGSLLDLAKFAPLSNYSLRLLTPPTDSIPYLVFGPAFHHDLFGYEIDGDPRCILWCNCVDSQRFVDLAHDFGFTPVQVSSKDGRGYLDFGQDVGDIQIVKLAMNMMQALICAFDISEQDQALVDGLALNADDEILLGKPKAGFNPF
jgi:hypothetical protein